MDGSLQPVGGAGTPGGPPVLPKSPVGGPAGPGASPMLSPGGGEGNKAASMQKVKTAIETLLVASGSFETGSKEQQALLRAVSSLNPLFSKASTANMVPAGQAAAAQAAKQGPITTAPPPGLISPNPPPGAALPVGMGETA